jgi:hypothetical protein
MGCNNSTKQAPWSDLVGHECVPGGSWGNGFRDAVTGLDGSTATGVFDSAQNVSCEEDRIWYKEKPSETTLREYEYVYVYVNG